MQIPHIEFPIEPEGDELGMTVYWVDVQVTEGEKTDLMLMLSFELAGSDIPDNAYVMAYATFPDATEENEGKFETVTCTTMYKKAEESED